MSRRGATALEFASAFFAFMLLTVGTFDLAFPVFAQAALGHAARAAVDRASDGRADPDELRETAVNSSLGFLGGPDDVTVRYIDALGTESEEPVAGGLVVVSVEGVPTARILSGLWGADLRLRARAADVAR